MSGTTTVSSNSNQVSFWSSDTSFSDSIALSIANDTGTTSSKTSFDEPTIVTETSVPLVPSSLTNAQKATLADQVIAGFTSVITQTLPLNFTNFSEVRALTVREFLSNFLTPSQASRLPDSIQDMTVEMFLKNFDILKSFIPQGMLDTVVSDALGRLLPQEALANLDPTYANMTMDQIITFFAGLLPSASEYPAPPTPVADPGPAPVAPVAPVPPAVVADPGVRPALPVAPVLPVPPVAPTPVANPGDRPVAPDPIGAFTPPRIAGGVLSGGFQVTITFAQAQNLLATGSAQELFNLGFTREGLAAAVNAYPAREAAALADYNQRAAQYNTDLAIYNQNIVGYDDRLATFVVYLGKLEKFNNDFVKYRDIDMPVYNTALANYETNLVQYNTYDERLAAFTKFESDMATFFANVAQYQRDDTEYQTVTLPAYTTAKANYDAYVVALAEYRLQYPDAPV